MLQVHAVFVCVFFGGNVSKTVIIDEKERWSQTRLDLSEIIVVNSLHRTTLGLLLNLQGNRLN